MDWNLSSSVRIATIRRRSPRGNVDWNEYNYKGCKSNGSFPTRERGLKYSLQSWDTDRGMVVPHAGTWIEIASARRRTERSASFPTRERGLKSELILCTPWLSLASFPTRECGLKCLQSFNIISFISRSPRGNVDWNQRKHIIRIAVRCRSLRGNVDWNYTYNGKVVIPIGRSPRGNVDWNLFGMYYLFCLHLQSFPTWECELK